MSAQSAPLLTPEQYLEIERAAETKSEYHDGQMYAMSGGTRRHSLLAMNFGAELRQALKHRQCFVFTSDLRVGAHRRSYMYPDLSVVCGESLVEGAFDDILSNPTVLVEVLSKSSEAYDRGFKFNRYRTIDSLAEYVLVSQDEARVQVFKRQPSGQWLMTDYSGLDSSCRLESLDCSIPLAEIYERVDFPDPPVNPL